MSVDRTTVVVRADGTVNPVITEMSSRLGYAALSARVLLTEAGEDFYATLSVEEALREMWGHEWQVHGSHQVAVKAGPQVYTEQVFLLRHAPTGVWVGTTMQVALGSEAPDSDWRNWDGSARHRWACDSVLDAKWASDPDEFLLGAQQVLAGSRSTEDFGLVRRWTMVGLLLRADPASDPALGQVQMMVGLGGYDNLGDRLRVHESFMNTSTVFS